MTQLCARNLYRGLLHRPLEKKTTSWCLWEQTASRHSKVQRAGRALCFTKPTAAILIRPAQDTRTSRALAALRQEAAPCQALPATTDEAIGAVLRTPQTIRNANPGAALVSGAAEHAAASLAGAALAARLPWDTLPAAADEAIVALIRAPRASRHARPIAALIAIATQHATLACGTGTAEVDFPCRRQALTATGHKVRSAAIRTVCRAAMAILHASSIAALGVRGADDAAPCLVVEAALVLRGAIHAHPSAMNHAFGARLRTTLSIWQADTVAALRRRLTEDAVACLAEAALGRVVASDANPAARDHARAAIL